MPYLDSAAITTRLNALQSAHGSLCSVLSLPNTTHGGKTVRCLKIAKGSGADRSAALVVAGLHAREWAPPDAVLSFAEKLLTAYVAKKAITYPAFTATIETSPGVTESIPCAAFTIPYPDVKRIVEKLDLYLVPAANPDGRDFTLAAAANKLWRKNRRPHPAGGACIGVDLNRNFDIAWDFDTYYDAAAAATVASTKNPCDPDPVYIGPSAASEPETKNIQHLITDRDVRFYIDVHSFGRLLLYPWGIEDDQSADPTMTFRNAAWDRGGAHGGRDGRGGVYGEFFPNAAPLKLLDAHKLIARRMKEAILASAGPSAKARTQSTYTDQQALQLYPTSGASDDFAFSRQFVPGNHAPIYAFTMESGSSFEGGFHPDDATQYPKIEREIHAALHALLAYAAGWTMPRPPSGGGCSNPCAIATAAYGSPLAPQVAFLRDLRDRELKATAFGRRFVDVAERVYYSFSPAVARAIERHPATRPPARALLGPMIAAVRACAAVVRPVCGTERRVRLLVAALLALAGVGTAAVGAGGYLLLRALRALLP